MPRADLVLNLVKAGSQGNRQLFRTTVEAIAAEERAKHHHQLADRLVSNLGGSEDAPRPSEVTRAFDGGHGGLLFELQPIRELSSMVLEKHIRTAVSELVEEQTRSDLLRSYGLEPRNRLLLVGPPGNGKTSLVEAIARELAVPLFVVRYEAIVGSFLGETSGRLRKLFDFVRTHQCVLFFDEFDTLGKERGDTHDTGEIKRVVSSLLLQIDALPSHVLIATATNHPELLDRAVWRRFQLRLSLPAPESRAVEAWIRAFEVSIGQTFGLSPKTIATRLKPTSYSELQEFCTDVQRRYVLSLPEANIRTVVSERLNQWSARVPAGK